MAHGKSGSQASNPRSCDCDAPSFRKAPRDRSCSPQGGKLPAAKVYGYLDAPVPRMAWFSSQCCLEVLGTNTSSLKQEAGQPGIPHRRLRSLVWRRKAFLIRMEISSFYVFVLKSCVFTLPTSQSINRRASALPSPLCQNHLRCFCAIRMKRIAQYERPWGHCPREAPSPGCLPTPPVLP